MICFRLDGWIVRDDQQENTDRSSTQPVPRMFHQAQGDGFSSQFRHCWSPGARSHLVWSV